MDPASVRNFTATWIHFKMAEILLDSHTRRHVGPVLVIIEFYGLLSLEMRREFNAGCFACVRHVTSFSSGVFFTRFHRWLTPIPGMFSHPWTSILRSVDRGTIRRYLDRLTIWPDHVFDRRRPSDGIIWLVVGCLWDQIDRAGFGSREPHHRMREREPKSWWNQNPSLFPYVLFYRLLRTRKNVWYHSRDASTRKQMTSMLSLASFTGLLTSVIRQRLSRNSPEGDSSLLRITT